MVSRGEKRRERDYHRIILIGKIPFKVSESNHGAKPCRSTPQFCLLLSNGKPFFKTLFITDLKAMKWLLLVLPTAPAQLPGRIFSQNNFLVVATAVQQTLWLLALAIRILQVPSFGTDN